MRKCCCGLVEIRCQIQNAQIEYHPVSHHRVCGSETARQSLCTLCEVLIFAFDHDECDSLAMKVKATYTYGFRAGDVPLKHVGPDASDLMQQAALNGVPALNLVAT